MPWNKEYFKEIHKFDTFHPNINSTWGGGGGGDEHFLIDVTNKFVRIGPVASIWGCFIIAIAICRLSDSSNKINPEKKIANYGTVLTRTLALHFDFINFMAGVLSKLQEGIIPREGGLLLNESLQKK